MTTNEKILSELCSQSKGMERLIKAFDLAVEKSGNYKRNPQPSVRSAKLLGVKTLTAKVQLA